MTHGSPSDLSETDVPPPPPEIHLVLDGEDVGPLTPENVTRLAAEGRIGPQTMAWHPALDEWDEIDRLPEIRQLLETSSTPPVPEPAPSPPPVLAGFGRRFAAGAVDMAISLGVLLGTAAALGFWPVVIGLEKDPDFSFRFNLLGSAFLAVYFILPMSRLGGGATPGYRLLRIGLVDEASLRPPGSLKTILWYVGAFAIVVGWVTYFIDSRRRMLHNLISKTLVIALPRRIDR